MTDATLVDTLPPFVKVVSVSREGRVGERTVTWKGQTISTGAEVTYTIGVRVDGTAPDGFRLQNRAVITAAGIHAEALDATTVRSPRVAGVTVSRPTPVPITAPTGGSLPTMAGILTVALGGGMILLRRLR